MTGLTLLSRLRELLHYPIPGIILTGDISTAALVDIARYDCTRLSKPMSARDLTQAIEQSLVPTAFLPENEGASNSARSVIFVVDDDTDVRNSIRDVLEQDGRTVYDFTDAEAFLATYQTGSEGCLLVDAYLPGMGGVGLLEQLRAVYDPLPTIVFTGNSDVAIAVRAMRAGASDFIEKPVGREALLVSIDRALRQSHIIERDHAEHEVAKRHLADLTARQRQVLDLVLAGHPSKNIAADLGISQRTVENHRAAIMRKACVKSLPELARVAIAAATPIGGSDSPPN